MCMCIKVVSFYCVPEWYTCQRHQRHEICEMSIWSILMSTPCTELNSIIAIPDEGNPSKCSIEMSSIIQHESGFNTIVYTANILT